MHKLLSVIARLLVTISFITLATTVFILYRLVLITRYKLERQLKQEALASDGKNRETIYDCDKLEQGYEHAENILRNIVIYVWSAVNVDWVGKTQVWKQQIYSLILSLNKPLAMNRTT